MYNSNIYAEKIVLDSTKSKTLPFLEKFICFYEDFIIISKNPFNNEHGLLLVECVHRRIYQQCGLNKPQHLFSLSDPYQIFNVFHSMVNSFTECMGTDVGGRFKNTCDGKAGVCS